MFEVKEKPKMVERALLVGIQFPDDFEEDTNNLLDELEELVGNLGIACIHKEKLKLREPRPHLLLGGGKAERVFELAKGLDCDCIIFDNELSPSQQRNWEKLTNMCVIDRQEIILDIFASRAHTKEAVLQVELARAEYNLPRLKRAWTHLSRQRGGGSTQRGEGEAQIELDQRMVRNRIARLKRELEEVVKHRGVQRKQRMKKPVPIAAIVGYTNAGKSSLLNRITNAEVLAEDKLFATLDPTTRRVELPHGQTLLLTDTVGFVRRLPHRLVEAFKATLEEAVYSDFLLHVIDASSPDAEAHAETTLTVLKELGADDKRIITVYNKADLLTENSGFQFPSGQADKTVLISTRTGQGMDELMAMMERFVEMDNQTLKVLIPYERYDLVGKLHDVGSVTREESVDEGVLIEGNFPERVLGWARNFERKDLSFS